MPSSLWRRRAISTDSSLLTVTTSSTSDRSSTSGTKACMRYAISYWLIFDGISGS